MTPIMALRTETSADAVDKLCRSATTLFYTHITTEAEQPAR